MSAPRFANFDRRGYQTVDVRRGYGEWAATYEDTVHDAMDVELLDDLGAVEWAGARRAVDLGCGTGRTGAWLHRHGVGSIDGVDVTPGMLARAGERGIYEKLVEADVAATGLEAEAYDLVTTSLVDEHLSELGPLYAEAFRLAAPGATYVLVGLHPQFLMATGIPTHFDRADGEAVAIDTHLHLLSDHVTAGLAAGWTLAEMGERLIDEALLAVKPKWAELVGLPFTFALVWRRR
jgi:SAM-dependent methyltransferase